MFIYIFVIIKLYFRAPYRHFGENDSILVSNTHVESVQCRCAHPCEYTYATTRMQFYPYEHLRKIEPADLEIDEFTTGRASLSMAMLPYTK
jgi:hypothetical protein